MDGFRIMYDFCGRNAFPWTPIRDGFHLLIMSVREADRRVSHVYELYYVQSRVRENPEVFPTANPLIALYSAPPYPSFTLMKVVFHSVDGGGVQSTNWKACLDGSSMNFFIAGMRANSSYMIKPTAAGSGWIVATC